MFREILITGLLALSGVLSYSVPAVEDPSQTCLKEHELWGSVDGTKFYICLNGVPIEQSCGPNQMFVNNSTHTGCLHVNKLSDKCAYHGAINTCTGDYLKQPQPSPNPTQFYICLAEYAEPMLLNCIKGRAFLKSDDGSIGCFPWAEWRVITGCAL